MKMIITAGGTSEPIDKVRKITNMSKGTLGIAMVGQAVMQEQVDKVYVLSPFDCRMEGLPHADKVEWLPTTSTQTVHDHLERLLTTEKIDAVIHAMAVSDYTVDYVCTVEDLIQSVFNMIKMNPVGSLLTYGYVKDVTVEDVLDYVDDGVFRLDTSSKMSSKSENVMVKMKSTPKLIALIKKWSPQTALVGFKLLENVSDEQLIEVASELKVKNDCDFVFANDIQRIRQSGHQGILLQPDGTHLHLQGKGEVAAAIVDKVITHVNAL